MPIPTPYYRKALLMYIRQAVAVCVALFMIASASQSVWAQDEAPQQAPQAPQFSENELNDIRLLQASIEAVRMGTEPAPAQFPLAWVHEIFITQFDGTTAVYFTLGIDRSQLSTASVSMYVRAYDKSVSETDEADPEADPEAVMVDPYAWSDVRFFEVPDDGYVMGSMAVPPGENEVFIAIKEASTGAEDEVTKISLLRHDLNAPNFSSPDNQLAMSSFMVGELEMKQPAATRVWDRHVILNQLHVRPKLDSSFTKADSLLLFFFIYGGQLTAMEQPDLQTSGQFYRVSPEGEETPFANPITQAYDPEVLAKTGEYSGQVPAQFGEIGFEKFSAGDFRLEMTVTDMTNDTMITQDFKFSVREISSEDEEGNTDEDSLESAQ